MLEPGLPQLKKKSPSQMQLELELKLDFQLLASEIIKHLRKDISQRELSEKLGYSFNQVGKWESQATQIKLSDFLLLGKALDVPIEKYFREAFWITDPEFNSQNIVRCLDVNMNFKTLENKKFSKNLSKWLKGVSEPDFAEVLAILGSKSPVLLSCLSRFLDCNEISMLRDFYQDYLKAIDTALADPNVCVLLAALRLEDYQAFEKHNEEILALHAACSIEQVRSGLNLLESQGLISFQNKKYWPHSFDLSFSNIRSPKLRGFQKHVLELAANLYPLNPQRRYPEKTYNPSMGSIRTVALSPDAARKIADAIAHFHETVGDIVKQDQGPKEAVQVIMLQTFPINFDK